MSRITGTDAANLIEAYNSLYAPQEEVELTEEQVQEDFENWVNSLVEEGHDLSEYTWEDMYEEYLNEMGRTATTGQMTAPRPAVQSPRPAPAAYNPAGGGMGGRRGGGSSPGALRPSFQSTGGFGRYAPPSMQQRTPAPAAPTRPAAPVAQRPARPVATTPTASAGSTKPAPPQRVIGDGSASGKPSAAPQRSFNPLMQRTFGYQTGNAPDQVAAASAGKAVPSGTALGVAANQDVRKKLNLPAKNLNQDLDLFDIIKGHLLDEGYADTEEAALQIMANMSEEWRQSIVEQRAYMTVDGQTLRDYNNDNKTKSQIEREKRMSNFANKRDRILQGV